MKVNVEFLPNPSQSWSYGCEHELGDWGRRVKLPPGFKVDEKDNTVMNSNGIAADPRGKLYPWGGEILTPPTYSCGGQVRHLRTIREKFPAATVNHRSNLHVHVLVPELVGNLDGLKRLAAYNAQWLPVVLPIIEPIPKPDRQEFPFTGDEVVDTTADQIYGGAMRRYRRRCVSHHTVITAARLERQLAATTLEDFFEAEVPRTDGSLVLGRPLWHLAPRHAVNLRHMREEVPTIEFRHFPGTLDDGELFMAVCWCRDWLKMAARGADPTELAHEYALELPKFPPYVHWMEERYQRTRHGGELSRGEIESNIQAILDEDEG